MKKRLFSLLLAVALISLSLAPAASAQSTVDATNTDTILSIARGFGDATLGTDSDGDPKISGRINGTSYTVFFYGCNDSGQQCKDIQFWSYWTARGVTAERLSTWNRDMRWGKSYIDKDGDTVLEMDANLYGGVTRKNLEDTFDWWRVVLTKFKDEVIR